MTSRRKKRTFSHKSLQLEETLLNEGERAAIQAIYSPLDPDTEDLVEPSRCFKCRKTCYSIICSRGAISIIFMFVIFLVGVSLIGVGHVAKRLFPSNDDNGTDEKETYERIRLAGAFFFSSGLFGVIGGLSNVLVLIMLFYKLPLLYGTGVIQRQHEQIGDVLRKIVLQMLFDNEHLEKYFTERINRFSVETNVVECITRALDSHTTEQIINDHLNRLYDQPESYYLNTLGVSQSRLKPMIKPAILSLCAETAPFVLGQFQQRQVGKSAICVPEIRVAMDRYFRHRMQDLSGSKISKLMKDIMLVHLSGLIVFGSIMGCLLGIVAQGFRFTINPEMAVEI